jgi:L-asparaginase
MHNILLLTTGGTISAKTGRFGLEPQTASNNILEYLKELPEDFTVSSREVLNLDSSNIQAEEWQKIARTVAAELPRYGGIVITHGTDTMAYTASMLSFMLQNLDKSVILTGSQMPINNPLTDARNNLYTAFSAVGANIPGVNIAFNHKIIRGCRAVKVRTIGFEAFESVNAPYLGEVYADGMRRNSSAIVNPPADSVITLKDKLCTDVFLLKLIPSTNPDIFDVFPKLNYRGIVIEAFGAGGMHFVRRNLYAKLKLLTEMGISVVVVSQCLYEPSDLSLYEVGGLLIECGAIPGRDMTTEAAVTKLMWALGQTDDPDEIRRIFDTNYADEITLP